MQIQRMLKKMCIFQFNSFRILISAVFLIIFCNQVDHVVTGVVLSVDQDYVDVGLGHGIKVHMHVREISKKKAKLHNRIDDIMKKGDVIKARISYSLIQILFRRVPLTVIIYTPHCGINDDLDNAFVF